MITLQLILENRSANPAELGFHLAISGRLASYDGVVDVSLCPVHPVLCAAPFYLQAHRPATHPLDLTEHACLVFSGTGTTWIFHSNRGIVSVDLQPRLLVDGNLTLLGAAVAGLGIALLPRYVADDALGDRSLEIVLPKSHPRRTGSRRTCRGEGCGLHV